jgi:hypothetical protein
MAWPFIETGDDHRRSGGRPEDRHIIIFIGEASMNCGSGLVALPPALWQTAANTFRAGRGVGHPANELLAIHDGKHIGREELRHAVCHSPGTGRVTQFARRHEVQFGLIAIKAAHPVAKRTPESGHCSGAPDPPHKDIGGGIVACQLCRFGQRLDCHAALRQIFCGDRGNRQEVGLAIRQQLVEAQLALLRQLEKCCAQR